MSFLKKISAIVLFSAAFFCLFQFTLPEKQAQAAQPFTVYINPGHGPASTGCGAYVNNVKESFLNEQIASRLYDALIAKGIRVYSTNPMSNFPSVPHVIKNPPATGGQYSFLNPPELLPAINTPWVFDSSLTEQPDMVISLHHNAIGTYSNSANGYEIYYSSTITSNYGKNSTTVSRSAEIAGLIDAEFKKSGFYLNPRSPSVKDMDVNSIIKYSGVPSVLVEAGFMTNATDFANMRNGSCQVDLVNRITNAVLAYQTKYPKDFEKPEMRAIYVPDPGIDSSFKVFADTVTDDSSGVKNVRFAVWSENGGQDDLKWYDGVYLGNNNWVTDVKAINHKNDAGKYFVEIYGTDNAGNSGYMGGTNVTLDFKDYKAPVLEKMETSDRSTLQTTFSATATVTDERSDVASVEFAVWPDEKQSTKLKWIKAVSIGSGQWKLTADTLAQFDGIAGKYYADCYATDTAGNRGYVGGTTFTILPDTKGPAMRAIYLPDPGTASSFKVFADTVTDAIGVQSVRFAVWSENNGMDDLIWHDGVYLGNNNWVTDVQAESHKNDAGKYYVDIYGVDKRGNISYMGGTTVTLDFKDSVAPVRTAMTTSERETQTPTFNVTTTVTDDRSGVADVSFAVWVDGKQQSTLKWIKAKNIGNDKWSLDVDTIKQFGGATGKYYVDGYATDKAGNRRYIGGTTFTMLSDTKGPVMRAIYVPKPGTASSFTAFADTVTDVSGVKNVRFAVWSENNGMDDLVWYNGTYLGSNNWVVNVDAANHKNDAGKYYIDYYGTDNRGNSRYMGGTTVMLDFKDYKAPTASSLSLSTTSLTTSSNITIWADNVKDDKSAVKSVRAAVWSNSSNAADLRWFNMSYIGNNNWQLSLDVQQYYKNSGTYTVDVYATDDAGNTGFLGTRTFEVAPDVLGYQIMGTSSVTAQQLYNFHIANGFYDASRYGGLGLMEFCQKYVDYCAVEGVKVQVAYAQMCLETNYLRYTGLCTYDQYNFAGLGATGDIIGYDGSGNPIYDKGICFTSVNNGILSQIQHLKAYASTAPLNLPSAPEYNRRKYVTLGCAPTVQSLSGKWATSTTYGDDVMRIVNAILSTPASSMSMSEAIDDSLILPDEPQPEETENPEPSPSPTPSETPEPEQSPEPSAEPSPTPSETPEPEQSPEPSAEPSPTPSEMPEPEQSPAPSESAPIAS